MNIVIKGLLVILWLLAVPGAAGGRVAQRGHDLEEAGNGGFRWVRHGRMCRRG